MTKHSLLLAAIAMLAAASENLVQAAEQAAPSRLIAVIQSGESSDHDKAVAFEQLAEVGDAATIAPLAKLLGDAKFSHYARYALQANSSAAATDALRGALDRLDGDQLVGVINSLMARRDQQAIPHLTELLGSQNPRVAAAAAGALATIGGNKAIGALTHAPQSTKPAFADAMLEAASQLTKSGKQGDSEVVFEMLRGEAYPQHIRRAATIGLIRSAPAPKSQMLLNQSLASQQDWQFQAGVQSAVQGSAPGFVQALAKALSNSTTDRQVVVLAAIKAKGASDALDAVRAAAKSTEANVRAAAASTLGALGRSADAPLLLQMALQDPPCANEARKALTVMQDDSLDGHLVNLLDDADASKQRLAADLIGKRRVKPAVSRLLQIARDSHNRELRLATIEALRRLSPGDRLTELLDLVINIQDASEKQLAEKAALAAAMRAPDREVAAELVAERLEKWVSADRGVLLTALGLMGGNRALELVAQAAESSDKTAQDQATRVLGTWPTADAAPVLLKLAGSDHPYAVRSLRGYLRIARQLNVGTEERFAMCRRGLEVAKREQERILALRILEREPSIQSLRLSASQLSSDKLGAKASASVVKIAEAVAAQDPAAAAAAAKRVVATGGSKRVLARARRLSGE